MVMRRILFSQAFAAILAFSPHSLSQSATAFFTINFAGGSSQFHVGEVDGQLHANINNQYFPADVSALRGKLAQYTSGTRFNVTIFGEQSRVATALE